MQHNSFKKGSPDDWLNYAASDLNLARKGNSPDIYLENLCFHSQQAAEKSIKAVYIFLNIEFPKTHNIKTLLDILTKEIEIPERIFNAAGLTDYAVTTRYPGDYEDISLEEYNESIIYAEDVLKWAKKLIKI